MKKHSIFFFYVIHLEKDHVLLLGNIVTEDARLFAIWIVFYLATVMMILKSVISKLFPHLMLLNSSGRLIQWL